MSFYPNERGPYNNNNDLNFIIDTKQNWAGITRKINSTNFQKTNVEYIQFWLLDDFSDFNTNESELGKILFHLGIFQRIFLLMGKNSLKMDFQLKTKIIFNYQIGEKPQQVNR